MDPETALLEARRTIQLIRKIQGAETGHPLYCEVPNAYITALVDHFKALDKWMSNGGFLPEDWQAGR
jgi:hypothetical protein